MMQRTRAMAAELYAGAAGERERSPAEHRRHVRVEVRLEVGFSITGELVKTYTRAVTHDISHGGACLAVTGCPEQLLERLAELPLLDVMIDIPGAPADNLRGTAHSLLHGRVEWLRRPAGSGGIVQIGLEFCCLDAIAENAIIDLIAHLLLDAREPQPAYGI